MLGGLVYMWELACRFENGSMHETVLGAQTVQTRSKPADEDWFRVRAPALQVGRCEVADREWVGHHRTLTIGGVECRRYSWVLKLGTCLVKFRVVRKAMQRLCERHQQQFRVTWWLTLLPVLGLQAAHAVGGGAEESLEYDVGSLGIPEERRRISSDPVEGASCRSLFAWADPSFGVQGQKPSRPNRDWDFRGSRGDGYVSHAYEGSYENVSLTRAPNIRGELTSSSTWGQGICIGPCAVLGIALLLKHRRTVFCSPRIG